MRALRVATYLAVVIAVLGGAAGFVVMAFRPPTATVVAALQEAPKVAPRPADKTVALGDREQARMKIAGADDATPLVAHDEGDVRAVRGGERSQRESRRRSDSYAVEARRSPYAPRLHGPE